MAEASLLLGGLGNDTLTGSVFDDTLEGGNGNDSLIGGLGNDLLTGGAGSDRFVVSAGKDTVTDLGTGDAFAVSAGAEAFISVTSSFTASSGTANSGAASLSTNGVNVNLAAATGSNGYLVVNNSGAAVSLTGSARDDTLVGGLGNDTLTGGAGNDVLTGGGGSDVFMVAGGSDTITDFSGGDGVVVSAGAVVNATVAATLVARNGTNNGLVNLTTDAIAINLSAITAGVGGFAIVNSSAAAGAVLIASGLRDTVLGGSGDDIIDGGKGYDLLQGGGGADSMLGGFGDDILQGGDGADSLNGGSGLDTLFGGGGGDTFVYASASDSFGPTYDTIADFAASSATGAVPSEADRIDLSALLGATDLVWGGKDSPIANGVWFRQYESANETWISADTNGSASLDPTSAEWVVRLTGLHDLSAADFIGVAQTGNPPEAADDHNTGDAVVEAGVAGGDATAIGNVLTNDGGTAGLAGVSISGVAPGAAYGPGAVSTGVAVSGGYGTLVLAADGIYEYVLDDSRAATEALAANQLAQDVFAYQLRNASGQTVQARLTVTISGSNDAPVLSLESGSGAMAEGTDASAGVLVTGLAASDVDAAAAPVLSLGGADAALFEIRTAPQGGLGLYFIGQPDFESGKVAYSVEVLAADGADGEVQVQRSFTLTIGNVDEAAPVITSGPVAAAIEENSGAGQVVYTVVADDSADISAGVSYSLGGEDAAAFTIDATTGEVKLTGNPDAETQASYQFEVVVTDVAGHATSQAVTLAINDVDEGVTPPTFSSGSQVEVNENQPIGSLVYTAVATAVSGAVTYSLGGADAAAFTLDGVSGEVHLAVSPDAELKADYQFEVTATDAAGHATSQAVSLAVGDLDEAAPVITSGPVAAAIEENSGAGQVVYTVVADDSADISAGVSYSLGGEDAAAFTIDATTGEVKLTGNPDAETQASYQFEVVVTDVAGHATSQAVSLAVADLDEVAPVITSGTVAAAIEENSGAGQVVYTVVADDSADISAGVSYSLGGVDAAAFTIDASTGEVKLTGNPDAETQASYQFEVTATDAAGHATSQAVSLAVVDLDEAAPVITSGPVAAAIEENSGAGQVVYTVVADDSADISAGVSYSLGGVDAAAFTIDASTGEVKLTGNPDAETQVSYQFEVTATDAAGHATSQAVSLAVVDLDEAAPVITSGPVAAAIEENSGAGQVVYTVVADDSADISAGVSYSLGGEDAAAFTIDATTGEVKLTGNPDAETQASYQFEVVVTDVAGHATSQAVTLAINDVDEGVTPPTFSSGSQVEVNENQPIGSLVYTAVATAVSGAVTYSLGGADAAAFTLDGVSGEVHLAVSPDAELKADYQFEVTATDAAGHATSQAVSLAVGDLDEAAPVITSGPVAAAIEENSGAGQVVYTVVADDSADISAGVSYSLGGEDAAAFTIDATTGEVRLTGNPDAETQAGYQFEVTATDAAGHATSRAVTLNVKDLSEAPRIRAEIAFSSSGFSFTVADEDVAGAISLVSPWSSLGPVNDGSTTTVILATPTIAKSGNLQVTDGHYITALDAILSTGTGNAEVLTVTGTGTSAVYGFNGADTLIGGVGVDFLYGGGSNDIFRNAAGTDVADGGSGTDTLQIGTTYVASTDASIVAVENIVVAGNSAAVLVDLSTQAEAFASITTSTFGDTIIGGGGADTLQGGIGADSLSGGLSADKISGGGGADTLVGGAGNDVLTGGGGLDTFYVDAGTDSVADLSESDVLVVSAGAKATVKVTASYTATSETTNSGTASLTSAGYAVDLSQVSFTAGGFSVTNSSAVGTTLIGSAGTDSLVGAGGNDSLCGGAGNDLLKGGAGNDVFHVDAGTDFVTDLGGADVLVIGSGAAAVVTVSSAYVATSATTNFGIATLTSTGQTIDLSAVGVSGNGFTITNGSRNATTFSGSAGSDSLNGGSGADTMSGGDGDDVLNGYAGADVLIGGQGSDTFVFSTKSVPIGVDRIADFTGGDDSILLNGVTLANAGPGVLDSTVNVTTAGFYGESISGADIIVLNLAPDLVNTSAKVDGVLNYQNGTFDGGVLILAYGGDVNNVALYYDPDANGTWMAPTLVYLFTNYTDIDQMGAQVVASDYILG
ncbi:hypothetical protein CATMQ487_19230 [Sphaerotilus microaerophilus]|uniref:Cadherin domain-containing protein n=2 Tax=Sphaerotilus microaerophilus TaxID=2914710 RepID=A0ABN6PLU7_9BURK|nr:hypothetical protein CATMQ487_19230 [Sphaerotilus sp. FB-5]